jgi:hypothetical protein
VTSALTAALDVLSHRLGRGPIVGQAREVRRRQQLFSSLSRRQICMSEQPPISSRVCLFFEQGALVHNYCHFSKLIVR